MSCFSNMTARQNLSDLSTGTRVTFPSGATSGTSTVAFVVSGHKEGVALVLTEETPFHPISHSWPDQEGDKGAMTIGRATVPVIDTLTAATTVDCVRTLYVDDQ